jgi:hypothetical protein
MPLSTTAKAAMLSQNSGEALLYLLVIASNDLGGDTIRLCSNPWEDVVSGGVTYSKFFFDVVLMGQNDETVPEVVLSVDNVDRAMVNFIRTQATPPTVTLSAVLASTPNVLEMGPLVMTLRDVGWNSLTVSGKIKPKVFTDTSLPGESMSPNLFRGLF